MGAQINRSRPTTCQVTERPCRCHCRYSLGDHGKLEVVLKNYKWDYTVPFLQKEEELNCGNYRGGSVKVIADETSELVINWLVCEHRK